MMMQNHRFNFSKFLLLVSFSVFFLSTVPANINQAPFINVPHKVFTGDSSRIILFLDTTVLGPFYFPIKGKVISHFGKRGHRMHTGTDIKLSHGDTVRSAFSGVVTKADRYYGYGILVVLRHPHNLETYYAHLSKSLVKEGDSIMFGTPVGLGGRTGRATTDHLHFEIRNKGKALNSEHFFSFNDCSIKSFVMEKKFKEDTEENLVKDKKHEKEKKIASVIENEKKYYTIKRGDTLFSLSKKYGTTVESICKLNGIKKSGVLKVGKKIRVI